MSDRDRLVALIVGRRVGGSEDGMWGLSEQHISSADAHRIADAILADGWVRPDTIKWCSQHDNPIKWGEHCWLGGMKPAPGARNFPDPEPCVVETPPRHFVGGSR